MKLFLTIIPVKNGFRVVPGQPSIDATAPEHEEYVFESLKSMNGWLPSYLERQLEPKGKAGK